MGKSIAILVLVVAAPVFAALPPAPQFDEETATVSVVVATSRSGDSYAVPEECEKTNVICLRFPIWFKAKPILQVYGESQLSEIVITTYTHYGQPEQDNAKAPRILLVLSNGDRHLMPTYASERVWLRSDGQYFMLITAPYPIPWLPCSVETLQESVSAEDFSRRARLAADDYLVIQYPELFVTSKSSAFPKYGISVTRLREHLHNNQPSAREFVCDADES